MHLRYIPIKIILFLFLVSSCKEVNIELKSYNLPEVPTIEATELFRIENPTKDSYFRWVRKIHILNSGNLVVQNYPDHQLYEYSPDGELINVIGRKGRGPGEFIETYMSFLSYNDSLHVYDFNNSRHQVMTKNNDGKWQAYRERVFRKIRPDGMVEQVPEKVIYKSNSGYYGIFRIFPRSQDTLSAHYAYVTNLNNNFEHSGEVSRLRFEEDLAIHRGHNSSQTVHNNQRFYKAFYNFEHESNQVILVRNNSNEIISIDSSNNESVIGDLPYEQFQIQEDELNKSLVDVNYFYSGMKEIIQEKILKHEPYYWNVILNNDLLWINLARSDTSKPNWIITTLDGKVINSFIGPEDIISVKIQGNKLYGSIIDADGRAFLVGYSLDSIKTQIIEC
jgi:hypothetical protein